ncbi:MAG: LytTR family transcriptional regulator, partial [Fimbriimonadaceae bacterium]|nr:LytTR family transcriptional regulator [Chitinophagales bacterium]
KFQIGEIESFLNDTNFMRIHRSFIVAINKIESYSYSEIEIATGTGFKKIPIGRNYKENILRLLGNKKKH